jgi:hypothetical protein
MRLRPEVLGAARLEKRIDASSIVLFCAALCTPEQVGIPRPVGLPGDPTIMKVTHLVLSANDRRAAAVLAAVSRLTLSEFVSQLVRSEAQRAGLVEFLAQQPESSQPQGHKRGDQ